MLFGTQSTPDLPNGLQLSNLITVNLVADKTSWVSKASFAYSEQVGKNLQEGFLKKKNNW